MLQGGFAARPWAVEPQSAELADASSRAYYAALHAARALLPPLRNAAVLAAPQCSQRRDARGSSSSS